MATVEFSRDLLALGSLVIDATPTGDYWLAEEGLVEPEFDQRVTFADDSPHVPGSLATQSVQGLGTWAAVIYTQAADEDALKANKRMLEATVRQFRYTTTLTIVGASDTYRSLPGKISWGEVDSGMVHGLLARCVVTIPVQPLEV